MLVLGVGESSFFVELLPVVGFRLKYNDCLMMTIQNDRFITCFPTFGQSFRVIILSYSTRWDCLMFYDGVLDCNMFGIRIKHGNECS